MNKNDVAIVTGGSSGIGFATAKKLLETGVDVTIVGRKETTLEEAKQNLYKLGNIEYIKADVTCRGQVELVVNNVLERNGKINYLVNNAGSNDFLSTEIPLGKAEEVWNSVIDANLKSAFLMSIEAAPHLCNQAGKIVNISSIGAFTGGSSKGAIAYSSAKAGVLGLTRALARELTPKGVTVNAVAPGFTYPTNFFGDKLSAEALENYTAQIPAGRAGSPEEIANAICFLLSKDASYISDEVLNVNGGWLFGK